MNTTVDTYTYHMMEHYFMYSIFHVSCVLMASTYSKHIDGGQESSNLNDSGKYISKPKIYASIGYNLLKINDPDINIL